MSAVSAGGIVGAIIDHIGRTYGCLQWPNVMNSTGGETHIKEIEFEERRGVKSSK